MNVAALTAPSASVPLTLPAAADQPLLAVVAAAETQQTQLLTVLASANQSGLGALLDLLA